MRIFKISLLVSGEYQSLITRCTGLRAGSFESDPWKIAPLQNGRYEYGPELLRPTADLVDDFHPNELAQLKGSFRLKFSFTMDTNCWCA